MIEVDTNTFYKVGIFCFIVSSICILANFMINFKIMNIFSKISMIGSFIFNLTLVGFFYYLYKNQNLQDTSIDPKDSTEDEIKGYVQELEEITKKMDQKNGKHK